MSDSKKGVAAMAAAALLGVGLLVANGADGCRGGEPLAGAETPVAEGSTAAPVLPGTGNPRNAVDRLETEGWYDPQVGLTAGAVSLLEHFQEEDAGLPAEEQGWQRGDEAHGKPEGTWCGLRGPSGQRPGGFFKVMTRAEDRATGFVRSLAPGTVDRWFVEETWSPKGLCVKTAKTAEELQSVKPVCSAPLRMASDRVTARGPDRTDVTWARCRNLPKAVQE